jgi:thiamine-monophosphate kinase
MSNAKDLGEHRIIELFFENIAKDPKMIIPFGDDVSAVDLGRGLAIIKTDMLVASTDIPYGMTPWQAGRKAVVGTISDLAAKGAEPKGVLVSIGIPPDYPETSLLEIAKGVNAAAREYGTYILGGDTNECKDLVVSVMILGAAKKNHIVLRSTAHPGDILAVTGPFGKTSVGLYLLREKSLLTSDEDEKELLESVYMPKARLKEGLTLNRNKLLTSATDSSDGLAWSLNGLGRASGVGFAVEELPTKESVKRFAELNDKRLEDLVFYGGEEYELVLTISPWNWKKAKEIVAQVGCNLKQIGYATKDKRIICKKGNEEIEILPKGWEHFKT